jgi:biotin synthase-like enzyme
MDVTKYNYEDIKAEAKSGCGKSDCAYCRLTMQNDGRAKEENLLKLGLVQKATER